MNTKLTKEETKKLKEVMSMIGKLSHQKSPRSREMMREIGEKGRKNRWAKYKAARECKNEYCNTVEYHQKFCVQLKK